MYEPSTCDRHTADALAAGESNIEPPECLSCQRRLYADCDGDGRCPEKTLAEIAKRMAKICHSIEVVDEMNQDEKLSDRKQRNNEVLSRLLGQILESCESMLDLDPRPPNAEKISGELGVGTIIEEGEPKTAPEPRVILPVGSITRTSFRQYHTTADEEGGQ